MPRFECQGPSKPGHPITESRALIEAPRDGRIIGMAVPQLVLPGYGLFHIGYDPE